MSIPTFDDWVQWGQRDAIEECEPETRGRFGAWIQQVLRKKLVEEERSRLREYLEDTAKGRGDCSTAFDEHMLNGRNKATLLGSPPLNKDGTKKKRFTKKEQTIAWAKVAKTCICRDVYRELRKGISRIKGKPKGSLPPVIISIDASLPARDCEKGRSQIEIVPTTDPAIEDQVTDREVENLLLRFPLEERERLVLWANLHGLTFDTKEMRALAGIGRQQLYVSAHRLGSRLKSWLIEVFEPSMLTNEELAAWSRWAWMILVARHRAVRPEGDENGLLRWVCLQTNEIVHPEKQPDGSFIWKRVTAPAATPSTPIL